MVRGKTAPVRSLAENLHQKVGEYGLSTIEIVRQHSKEQQTSLASTTTKEELKSISPPPVDGSPNEESAPATGGEGEIHLTALQLLISNAIISNKGAIHFHALQDFIIQNWDGFRGKDGQVKTPDCKRAILASLSKNIRTLPLFKRVTKKYWWQLDQYNPLFTADLDQAVMNLELIDEPLHNSASENNTNGQKNGAKKGNRNKDTGLLTELQVLIIESIAERGGTATIEEITESVSPQWGTLRRRDGSKYTADCRRAVQASLANNPSSRPIFRKESKKKGIWGLAKRAQEYLDQKEDLVVDTAPEPQEDTTLQTEEKEPSEMGKEDPIPPPGVRTDQNNSDAPKSEKDEEETLPKLGDGEKESNCTIDQVNELGKRESEPPKDEPNAKKMKL